MDTVEEDLLNTCVTSLYWKDKGKPGTWLWLSILHIVELVPEVEGLSSDGVCIFRAVVTLYGGLPLRGFSVGPYM